MRNQTSHTKVLAPDSPLSRTDAPLEGVRWIVFDAVGTLICPDHPVAVAYAEAARRHGSRLTEAEIARRFRIAWRGSEQDDYGAPWGRFGTCQSPWGGPGTCQSPDSHGQVTNLPHGGGLLTTSEAVERERWRKIVAAVIDDAADPRACFDDLFAYFGQPSAWVCYPDVADALRRLHDTGYRLAVASNFDARLHTVCDGLPELRPIELRAVSSEIGYRKPSRDFYAAVAREAACEPGRMLMVGDDWENDVRGAERAGWRAVQVCRKGPLEHSGQIAHLGELAVRH